MDSSRRAFQRWHARAGASLHANTDAQREAQQEGALVKAAPALLALGLQLEPDEEQQVRVERGAGAEQQAPLAARELAKGQQGADHGGASLPLAEALWARDAHVH